MTTSTLSLERATASKSSIWQLLEKYIELIYMLLPWLKATIEGVSLAILSTPTTALAVNQTSSLAVELDHLPKSITDGSIAFNQLNVNIDHCSNPCHPCKTCTCFALKKLLAVRWRSRVSWIGMCEMLLRFVWNSGFTRAHVITRAFHDSTHRNINTCCTVRPDISDRFLVLLVVTTR